MQSVILYLHRCQPGSGLSNACFPFSLLKQPCIDLKDLCTPGLPRLYPRTRRNISLSTLKRMPAVFEHITHFLVSVWTWLSPCNVFTQLPSLVQPGSVLWTCISHQCDPDTRSFCKTQVPSSGVWGFKGEICVRNWQGFLRWFCSIVLLTLRCWGWKPELSSCKASALSLSCILALTTLTSYGH